MSTVAVKHQPTIVISSPTRSNELDELINELESLGFSCRWTTGFANEISQATLEDNCCFVLLAARDVVGDDMVRLREQRDQCGQIPFAFVCSSGSLDGALAALRMGACDLIKLPLRSDSLEIIAATARNYAGRQQCHVSPGPLSPAASAVATPSCRRRQTLDIRCSANVKSVDRADHVLDDHVLDGAGSAPPAANPVARAENPLAREAEAAIANRLATTLVGRSSQMESVRRLIARIAPTEATVMIHGESGTGKKLVAAAIHDHSHRAGGAFVPVNISAIPPGLAEGELFGTDRSLDGNEQRIGYCQAADGGTLFLDEIGAMEMRLQPALLRFLQEGLAPQFGSANPHRADARIITATDRCPTDLVRGGQLREDLFYQLHVAPIHIPALRDRREDIADLAELFLQRTAAHNKKPVVGFTASALEILQSYDWPGNARQLKNTVEHLVILAHGRLIDADEIPANYRVNMTVDNSGSEQAGVDGPTKNDSLPHLTPMQLHERAAIVDALQRVDGHVVQAARLLGVGQATVYRKIRLYAIPRNRSRRTRRPH